MANSIYADARRIREGLGQVEAEIEKMVGDYDITIEDAVDVINDILGEFTSAYHEPMRIRLMMG